MNKASTIILRERLPDALGRPTGWLILGKNTKYGEREIVAILSHPVGLALARQYAALLAKDWGVKQVTEELNRLDSAVPGNQVMDYGASYEG